MKYFAPFFYIAFIAVVVGIGMLAKSLCTDQPRKTERFVRSAEDQKKAYQVFLQRACESESNDYWNNGGIGPITTPPLASGGEYVARKPPVKIVYSAGMYPLPENVTDAQKQQNAESGTIVDYYVETVAKFATETSTYSGTQPNRRTVRRTMNINVPRYDTDTDDTYRMRVERYRRTHKEQLEDTPLPMTDDSPIVRYIGLLALIIFACIGVVCNLPKRRSKLQNFSDDTTPEYVKPSGLNEQMDAMAKRQENNNDGVEV